MTAPLVWMPTLDSRLQTENFEAWEVRRFLKTHKGRGHIVARTPGLWPSTEAHEPAKGGSWYCTAIRKVAKRSAPAQVTVEMPVPLGAGDPALEVLEAGKNTAPLQRLVLLRPKPSSLAAIAVSVHTLKDTVGVPLWLDVRSFGWTASAYLAAVDPDLNLGGVEDGELWRMIRLAEQLDRPLMMGDLSGDDPVPIPALPRFEDENLVPQVSKTLPSWGRSR